MAGKARVWHTPCLLWPNEWVVTCEVVQNYLAFFFSHLNCNNFRQFLFFLPNYNYNKIIYIYIYIYRRCRNGKNTQVLYYHCIFTIPASSRSYIYIYIILPRYMSFLNPSTLSVDGCLIIFRVFKKLVIGLTLWEKGSPSRFYLKI
jgi:hypothetical protein